MKNMNRALLVVSLVLGVSSLAFADPASTPANPPSGEQSASALPCAGKVDVQNPQKAQLDSNGQPIQAPANGTAAQ
jgi:hypothetical protein